VSGALRLGLVQFAAKRASLSETSLAAGWLTQDSGAGCAEHNGRCMREHRGDLEAAWALNIHEEGVG
jgi:hypothetical protein